MSTPHLRVSVDGPVAYLTLNRPEKRNAVNRQLIGEVGDFFSAPPPGVKFAILDGAGEHFCSGLDLSTIMERVSPLEAVELCRLWHAVLQKMQFGGTVVIAVMHGAVLGGGLEVASAAHIRIAEENAFFGLPEAQRGIFVGGGATVRVGKVIGAGRMTEMMLTGRTFTASEAFQLGIAHHVVPSGTGLAKAQEIAGIVAKNAPLTNYLAIQVLPRIENMGIDEGFMTEALAAALPRFHEDSQDRVSAFLSKGASRPE